jgi:type II secretory pathway pseudopilin PulG
MIGSTRRPSEPRGFTLVELTICMAVLMIVAVAISPALIGAQRNSQNVLDSVMSNQARDGRRARMAFQSAGRRAIRSQATIPLDARSIDLPYYDSPDSTYADRYTNLTFAGGDLTLSAGQIAPNGRRTQLSSTVLCQGVSDGTFTRQGTAIWMKLVLTQGTRQVTVVTAAVMNN